MCHLRFQVRCSTALLSHLLASKNKWIDKPPPSYTAYDQSVGNSLKMTYSSYTVMRQHYFILGAVEIEQQPGANERMSSDIYLFLRFRSHGCQEMSSR